MTRSGKLDLRHQFRSKVVQWGSQAWFLLGPPIGRDKKAREAAHLAPLKNLELQIPEPELGGVVEG